MIKSSFNLLKVTAITLVAIFVLSGCKAPKDEEKNGSDTTFIDSEASSSFILVLKMFKATLNGQQISSSSQSQISLPKTFYPLSVRQTPVTLMSKPEGLIAVQNNKGSLWFKYKTGGSLTLSPDSNGLMINGVITSEGYFSKKIHTFTFSNSLINSDLIIETGSIKIDGQVLPKNQILQSILSNNLLSTFGAGWANQQAKLIKEVSEKNLDLLEIKNSKVEFNSKALKKAVGEGELVDFTLLDKQKILQATIFYNAPKNLPADKKWTKIVNIPDDLSTSTMQLQTVIATNAARSTARYCNGHTGFPAGNYPAVSPVEWDQTTANAAEKNTNEQKRKDDLKEPNNGQGHWITSVGGIGYSQNVYVRDLESAISVIIGIGPTHPGNNAGEVSWAGHAGHCQNVMGASHTKVGVAWLPGKSGTLSYWTQNFK